MATINHQCVDTTSTNSHRHQYDNNNDVLVLHNQVLFCGRVLGACLLMAAVLLVWAQQYEYHQKQKYNNSHLLVVNVGVIDDDKEADSQKETADSKTTTTTTTFSCKIDQLELELPQVPDLIIAGAPKCGTTTLAHWLLDHPNVIPTKKWEVHFFTTGIHPREFEPLLRESGDDDNSSSGRNNSSDDEERRKRQKRRRKEDIICELRKRYLHQWPDLSRSSSSSLSRHQDNGNNDQRGENNQQQQQQQHRVYTFDKTPDYLYPSRVPALIRALFATATTNTNTTTTTGTQQKPPKQQQRRRPKIVVLLRNPIDRAYSHYRMTQRMIREEHVSFEVFVQREINLLKELGLLTTKTNSPAIFDEEAEAIEKEEAEITMTSSFSSPSSMSLERMDQLYDQVSDQLKGHNYLSRGLYAVQLERWFRHDLGQDLLIIPYKELTIRPQHVYNEVLNFVGMPQHTLSKDMMYTKFNYNDAITEITTPLSNSTRSLLKIFFKQANQDLLNLLEQHNKRRDYDYDDW